MHSRISGIVMAFALVAGTATPSFASDRFYAAFYASQDARATPSLSHTFACFVKVTFDDSTDPPRVKETESTTISWLPASGSIQLFGVAVPGRNFTLEETMAWANSRKLTTLTWGPYEIDGETYDAAVAQAAKLKTGKIAYVAELDADLRPNTATNCIHAVSDALTAKPALHTGVVRGVSATELVVNHFEPSFVHGKRVQEWLRPHLGKSGEFDGSEKLTAPPK